MSYKDFSATQNIAKEDKPEDKTKAAPAVAQPAVQPEKAPAAAEPATKA